MSETAKESLPFEATGDAARLDACDRESRVRAVDPRCNVALEASAGTGKTRVLVDRYVNLLRAGVDPRHVLAITFTRKAAAEMRERIVATLRTAAARGEILPARWRELRDRMDDIAISTIDAFCLALLREFPLEADLDPGFALADETEVPRLVDESLDRTLRSCRAIAGTDPHVALAFAQLGERRVRAGLAALLPRRLLSSAILARFDGRAPRELTTDAAVASAVRGILDVLAGMPGGLAAFRDSGPPEPAFAVLVLAIAALERMAAREAYDPARVQASIAHVRDYFLTQAGTPRAKPPHAKAAFASTADWTRHRALVAGHAEAMAARLAAYRRDLNILVARGVARMFAIADEEYRRTLDAHAVLDFPDVLARAVGLLRQMEEFAQSRFRLESRFHHVLVDEFQDTSRAQWELVALLVKSWGEGVGLAHEGPLPPSIFIVGDRKQSIYRFRDADASIFDEAARHMATLRPQGDVRRSIARSFRSTPALLAFVNDLCRDVDKVAGRPDAFRYDEQDRFPVEPWTSGAEAPGLVVGETSEACAASAAAEIARLLATAVPVRDRQTGQPRPVRPGDIAILFRTRESHRQFEQALEARGIPSYVYKGLGFFDADETKDVIALLWFLADPASDLRVAAWLRSRWIRMSDEALRQLAPRIADAVCGGMPDVAGALAPGDRHALDVARAAWQGWRHLVDRLPPAEVLDRALMDAAYARELRGPRLSQARENLKKIRALVRRIQNRGYATLHRVVSHLDRLAVGDEANAAVDAFDSVNLMTVHASKGLEFPVVFVVNLGRGTGNRRGPIRVVADPSGEAPSVAVGDFESEADADEAAREREETKRLLYVALTRARDRLYLGMVLKDGRVTTGRGSLADVLPPALLACVGEAARGGDAVWQAGTGTEYRFVVCPDAADVGESAPSESGPAGEEEQADFAPIIDESPAAAVTPSALGVSGSPAPPAGDGSNRLVGTVVHRCLQHAATVGRLLDQPYRFETVEILSLVRQDESAGIADLDAFVDQVRSTAAMLVARPDVQALYATGTLWPEIPFAMEDGGRIVRGTIDGLVAHPDGAFTIVELKTGRPRPEHQAQVETYRRAIKGLFPQARVEARLVYASGAKPSG